MVSRRHCARAVSAPSSSISAVSSPIDPAAPGVASAFHGIIAGRSPLRPAWGPSAPASRGVCVHGTARPTSCVVTYSAALLNSRFGHSSRIQWNYMSTYCEENKGIHKYNTRQKYYFHIDAIKSEIGKRSIKYKGSKLWNTNQLNLKKYSHFSPLNINFKTIYCSLWHVSSSTVLHLHLHLHLAPCCLIVSVFLSAC